MWAGLLGPVDTSGARRTAVMDSVRTLSHGELRTRVDAFAARLMQLGVRPGDKVLIVTGKDVETVVALYAVMRCGAAYVPVDRAAPLARQLAIATEVSARVCIAPGERLAALQAACGTVVDLGTVLQAPEVPAAFPALQPDGVAYLIFTSGSTGRPKGVVITHGNLAALFGAHRASMQMDERSVCMNTTPFHFDGSVGDCLFPLSLGAAVQLAPALPVPTTLLRLMQDRRVTHLCIVPSSLDRLAEVGATERVYDLSHLQTLIFGGEAADVQLLERWRKAWPQLRLINGYGPTEACYVCVSRVWEPGEPLGKGPLPIGRPYRDMRAVLLDDEGQLLHEVADGMPAAGDRLIEGELALAGPQLSPGYWQRPVEDARAFVQLGGERFYRTGDICRLDDAHELVYCGRKDAEAKINGYRIHMAEVQAGLCEQDLVRDCLAFPVRLAGKPAALGCALACSREVTRAEVLACARAAQERLPTYMVPKYFLVVSGGWPLLPSGKADVRKVSALLHDCLATTEDSVFFTAADGQPASLACIQGLQKKESTWTKN
ncbi:MAG TPA: amino acid adenylation domain-containing protein [Burkholderiaceae bacterium]|nr:amino acid adenylation domain-containing protein [Burkholderiaceae bacterium]